MDTTQKKLRYNIKARLEAGGRRHYLQVRNKVSRAGLFSSVDTWYKWLDIEVHQSRDIPASALRFIAETLRCSMEELFTDTQNKIQNERNAFGIKDQSSIAPNQVD
jgi:hypothetical protein